MVQALLENLHIVNNENNHAKALLNPALSRDYCQWKWMISKAWNFSFSEKPGGYFQPNVNFERVLILNFLGKFNLIRNSLKEFPMRIGRIPF